MSRYDRQKELAIAGFITPVIGLGLTALIDAAKTTTESAGDYSTLLWIVLFLLDVYLIYDDLNSILVNGPVFAICFLSSYNWLNGMGLKEIIMTDLLVLIISCVIALVTLYVRDNYYYR